MKSFTAFTRIYIKIYTLLLYNAGNKEKMGNYIYDTINQLF